MHCSCVCCRYLKSKPSLNDRLHVFRQKIMAWYHKKSNGEEQDGSRYHLFSRHAVHPNLSVSRPRSFHFLEHVDWYLLKRPTQLKDIPYIRYPFIWRVIHHWMADYMFLDKIMAWYHKKSNGEHQISFSRHAVHPNLSCPQRWHYGLIPLRTRYD